MLGLMLRHAQGDIPVQIWRGDVYFAGLLGEFLARYFSVPVDGKNRKKTRSSSGLVPSDTLQRQKMFKVSPGLSSFVFSSASSGLMVGLCIPSTMTEICSPSLSPLR